MTKTKDEQTGEFGFPSEGWYKIKMESMRWGYQRSMRKEWDVLIVTHMAETMSLTSPASEEHAEESQFLFLILPVNSTFTDTSMISAWDFSSYPFYREQSRRTCGDVTRVQIYAALSVCR